MVVSRKEEKAEEQHPEEPERDDGKRMRNHGNKRKAGEESKESRLKKDSQELEGIRQDGEQEGVRESTGVVEVAEVEVNEEEEEWMTEEESRRDDERGDLDPEQVRQGREEEMNYIVKTWKMFESGSWEDATSRAGKCLRQRNGLIVPRRTTVEKTFVRCRLVARDFKPKREREEGFVRIRCRGA